MVGPYLSRREIVAELGSPVWDDDEKQWYVADSATLGVLGLCAVHRDAVCSFYVNPDSRRQTIGYALLHHVTSRHDVLTATATDASRDLFGYLGFVEVGTRGRFTLMRRETP
jgi:GNAT superfamily N-acetyltransferase